MQTTPDPARARPVVALMGEFSAGKSTLANLLIGEGVSPVRVTATQLPPIWYCYGAGGAERVDHSGAASPLDLGAIDGVSVDDTAFIKVYLQVDVLELMDLIDMPGISDPNLSARTWQQIMPFADSVLWCSHATQAWRQSEAATWGEMPSSLHATSLLLLTRFDKILTESDRRRLLARVEAETEGLFEGVYPISLLQASAAEDDRNAWEESGAEAFTQKLLDIVFNLVPAQKEMQLPQAAGSVEAAAVATAAPISAVAGLPENWEFEDRESPHDTACDSYVAPRRVVPRGRETGQRERLPRSALKALAL